MESTILGRMLRHHWAWIALFALVGLAVGAVVGRQAPVEFTAKSSVVSTVDASGGIRPNELWGANNVAIARAQTYAEVATSEPVLARVASQLGLTETPAAIASRATVTAVPTSPVVSITVTAESGQAAADLANAIAQSVSDEVNAGRPPPLRRRSP